MLVRRLRNNILVDEKGFTVIEILIALVLIVSILGIVLSDPFSNSGDLDLESDNIERAIRFMTDEAALRNSVTRIHFLLDKSPQEYAVEFGPNDSFILPPESESQKSIITKEEEEKEAKLTKSTNLKFNKIREFQDSNIEIHESVKIIGVADAVSLKLKKIKDASLYAFPSGERDESLVILSNEERMIALIINPFNKKIEKKTYSLSGVNAKNISEVQSDKAKEIFETWLKNK